MGIPSYFAHVVRNYADVIRKLDSKLKVHNLYLDSNSIIYDALYRLSSEETSQIEINIIKKVCEKIEEYIKIIYSKIFRRPDGRNAELTNQQSDPNPHSANTDQISGLP